MGLQRSLENSAQQSQLARARDRFEAAVRVELRVDVFDM
jgi:hypothetical protein